MATKKQTDQDKLTQAARAKHGRIISLALPSGEFLIFRMPTADELADFFKAGDKKRSARTRQLAQQCCVHPRGEDKAKPVEELKAIIDRQPGIPPLAVKNILEHAGDDAEYTKGGKGFTDDAFDDLREKGAIEFCRCPDGEVCGIRCPTELEFNAWQDADSPADLIARDRILSKATLVGDVLLLDKYPALARNFSSEALGLAGLTQSIEVKKG